MQQTRYLPVRWSLSSFSIFGSHSNCFAKFRIACSMSISTPENVYIPCSDVRYHIMSTFSFGDQPKTKFANHPHDTFGDWRDPLAYTLSNGVRVLDFERD